MNSSDTFMSWEDVGVILNEVLCDGNMLDPSVWLIASETFAEGATKEEEVLIAMDVVFAFTVPLPTEVEFAFTVPLPADVTFAFTVPLPNDVTFALTVPFPTDVAFIFSVPFPTDVAFVFTVPLASVVSFTLLTEADITRTLPLLDVNVGVKEELIFCLNAEALCTKEEFAMFKDGEGFWNAEDWTVEWAIGVGPDEDG